MNKEKCSKCDKIATWMYAPGYSGGGSPFHCDEHVWRGCSCNMNSLVDFPDDKPEGVEGVDWKWVLDFEDKKDVYKPGEYWTELDSKGREYPCCEYWYEENGWDEDEEAGFIEDEDSWNDENY